MSIDVSPELDGGILKTILKAGEDGPSPNKGDEVTVHYVGTFDDGSEFDSSRSRDQYFKFTLGEGNVIKGWDMAVATMKKNESCRITCKPEYAYGVKGSPPKIPPNSTLTFEIELFSWKGEDVSIDQDEGVVRSKIDLGEGHISPNDGSSVSIHIKGVYDGVVFDERDIDFTLGEGVTENIVDGIEQALQHFNTGEKSLLSIKSKYAFGDKGYAQWNLPPFADIEYTVKLKSFEKLKDTWEMNSDEKLEQAEVMKAKGTKNFQNQQYSAANKFYSKVVDYLEHETFNDENEVNKRKTLLTAAYNNLAACGLKIGDNITVIENCDKAVNLSNDNIKAYFRRGQAKLNIQEFDQAIDDFEKVLVFDYKNTSAKNQIKICQHKIKLIKDQEKKKYAGMFDKFATKDNSANDEIQSSKDVFDNVNDWKNKMADGMMTIQQEAEAFGEEIPEPQYDKVEQNDIVSED